jgi:hypothetical protein
VGKDGKGRKWKGNGKDRRDMKRKEGKRREETRRRTGWKEGLPRQVGKEEVAGRRGGSEND